MSYARFHVPEAGPGGRVSFPEWSAHHAREVLRLRAGDLVRVFDGRGAEFEATQAARRHASLNHVALGVVQADGERGFRPRAFDLVLANLMAPLLLERRLELMALLARGATLILSGFLDTDVAEVTAAYSPFGVPAIRRDGEWAALVLRNPV